MIIIGTMTIVVTIGGVIWSHDTSANPFSKTLSQAIDTIKPGNETLSDSDTLANITDDTFLQTVGAASDEEVYDALYEGKSLAQITQDYDKDVQQLIDLQVGELTTQLTSRLASGSITTGEYDAQVAEATDIITRSIHASSSG
jgi:hypothetical protein